jgi:hypothetical protein
MKCVLEEVYEVQNLESRFYGRSIAAIHEASELSLTTGSAEGQALVYGFRSS